MKSVSIRTQLLFPLSAICGVIFCLAASPALADTELDQNYVPSNNIGNLSAGFGSGNTDQQRAETFTVGKAGNLVRIDVFILQFLTSTAGNLVSDIDAVDSSGHPSNTLAEITTPGSTIGAAGFYTLDFSSDPVPVTVGEQLGIVLYATPGNISFSWVGDDTNPYLGGEGQEQVIGNHTWVAELSGGEDLGFRTFVNVPEPAIGSMLIAILCGTCLRRRRRSPRLAAR